MVWLKAYRRAGTDAKLRLKMNAQYMTFDGETFSRDTYNLCSIFKVREKGP